MFAQIAMLRALNAGKPAPPAPRKKRARAHRILNLKVVQTLLGHSTIAITAEFYANVTVEDVRAARMCLGSALTGFVILVVTTLTLFVAS